MRIDPAFFIDSLACNDYKPSAFFLPLFIND